MSTSNTVADARLTELNRLQRRKQDRPRPSAAVRRLLREYEAAQRDKDATRLEQARLTLIDVAGRGIFE